jgi:hypothetical protein
MTDMVNFPEQQHLPHPAGIAAIDVIEPFSFNVGSAVSCLWEAGLKGDSLEDLMRAHWHIVREIGRLQRGKIEEALTARLQEHLAGFRPSAPEPASAAVAEEAPAEGDPPAADEGDETREIREEFARKRKPRW